MEEKPFGPGSVKCIRKLYYSEKGGTPHLYSWVSQDYDELRENTLPLKGDFGSASTEKASKAFLAAMKFAIGGTVLNAAARYAINHAMRYLDLTPACKEELRTFMEN